MNNELFKNKYRIKSTRWPGYDYGSPGWYFVTICTKNREHYFGHIENGKMLHTEIGEIADQYWRQIPDQFPHVNIDEYIIMPDHMHGIVEITRHVVVSGSSKTPVIPVSSVATDGANGMVVADGPDATVSLGALVMPVSSVPTVAADAAVEMQHAASLQSQNMDHPRPTNRLTPGSIPTIIRSYKSAVKKHATMNDIPFAWQSRYHDHIIRNENSLQNIREYIRMNPVNWREGDDERKQYQEFIK